MSITVHPDEPCYNCKQRLELRLHPDGSIGGAWHRCPNAPPGPPGVPLRYPKGRFYPKEGANVVYPENRAPYGAQERPVLVKIREQASRHLRAADEREGLREVEE